MSTYFNIESHRSMVFDEVRNRAYDQAIRAAVGPHTTVLDLGAGLGIHGLLAASAGAKKVILLDVSPVVDLCGEIARANNLSQNTEVIRKRIEDIESLEPVDIIVSVFTGNFLLTEDLLPSMFSARERFLKPGGLLIPGRARMQAALVTAQPLHDKHVAIWSRPILGLDFGSIRRFAANTLYYSTVADLDADLLCRPVTLQELDFSTATTADCHCAVEIEVTRSALCHGLLGWFDMQLGTTWVSTGPEEETMHWSVAFLPLDPPLNLLAGERVTLELDRPQFGEWTWTVGRGADRQRHSTFQSNVANLAYLRKVKPDIATALGDKGELALLVLSQMSAGKTISEIITLAREQFSVKAERDLQFDKQVRNLIVEFGESSAK